MKIQILLTAALSTTAVLADEWPGAEKECGRLGAMKWDPRDLPEGVNPSEIRKCADHPMGAGNYWGLGEYMPNWIPRNPLADLDWTWSRDPNDVLQKPVA